MEQKTSPVLPSSFTRRARARDRALRVALWSAAVLTMGILGVILGFILYRGTVSDNQRQYPVIGKGTDRIPIGPGEHPAVALIVNSGVRVTELAANEARDLLSGGLSNWGNLSSQDLPVRLYFPDTNHEFSEAVRRALLGPDTEWVSRDGALPDAQSVISRVAAVRGAIGWVPDVALAVNAPRGVKPVTVRTLAVIAAPQVSAIHEGRQLSALRDENVAALLSGAITNWKSLGGPDLPVRIVAYDSARWERSLIGQLFFGGAWMPPAGAIPVSDPGSMKWTVSSTAGAVGLCAWTDAEPGQILLMQRREVDRNLALSFFLEEPRRAGRVGGVSTIILNTILMLVLTLAFSTPIGVAAATYLTEYARHEKIVSVLRFGVETLAGIPSIIFGLFGFIVFVTILRLGIGLLSGTLALTLMVLPTIIRTSEEAVKSVPLSLREVSFALGATKWQTTVRVVLRCASPGILAGIILALGRAAGEAAVLLFTMGTDYRLVDGLRSSARTLAVHLYLLVKEGTSFDKAFATATVLVIIVLAVNFATTRLIGRLSLGSREGARHG
ncbi:MAG TPA: phosphate ABC transporter permease PstA [Spirochaetia bacterium]|nr:phosphate ABC transporter permease PstA [Spirochaetia bacterium]